MHFINLRRDYIEVRGGWLFFNRQFASTRVRQASSHKIAYSVIWLNEYACTRS
jgi:hypothetical protein